jgi:HSP20 family molecular chaperone IbpA
MSPTETVWMWRRAWSLLERAERLQRQIYEPRPAGAERQPVWEPPIDVYETSEGYQVLVALPGVDPTQIEVELEGTVLTVAGRCGRLCEELSAVRRMEIPRGSFERRLELPGESLRIVSQRLANGCLVLFVSRIAGARSL